MEIKQSWDFFIKRIGDKSASIFLNLGLKEIAPVASFNKRISIFIEMQTILPNGLSSSEENETLWKIEDILVESLENKHAIYIARMTHNGRRDIFFYAQNDEILLDKAISDSMVKFPSYQYSYKIEDDNEWDFYLNFLYPNSTEMQVILSRHVIQNLQNNGDDLTSEREVDHFLYFDTAENRELFLAKISDAGFKVLNQNHEKERKTEAYTLNISRVDKVDQNSVDKYVLFLYDVAEECNGRYDGWGCEVVK
jgi:uncharacterized protein (TIGR01619 family)